MPSALFACLLIMLLSLVLPTGWASAADAPSRLAVRAGETQEELACLPFQPGEEFHLLFINSIYLAPVKETMTYTVEEGIVVIRVESPSAGVFEYYGLPGDGSGKAALNRRIGEIRIRSSDYASHRLIAGGKTLDLKGLVADGDPLVVTVEEGECCDGSCQRPSPPGYFFPVQIR